MFNVEPLRISKSLRISQNNLNLDKNLSGLRISVSRSLLS